jgi:hypothetical protein
MFFIVDHYPHEYKWFPWFVERRPASGFVSSCSYSFTRTECLGLHSQRWYLCEHGGGIETTSPRYANGSQGSNEGKLATFVKGMEIPNCDAWLHAKTFGRVTLEWSELTRQVNSVQLWRNLVSLSFRLCLWTEQKRLGKTRLVSEDGTRETALFV